jgi:hypothetical protein
MVTRLRRDGSFVGSLRRPKTEAGPNSSTGSADRHASDNRLSLRQRATQHRGCAILSAELPADRSNLSVPPARLLKTMARPPKRDRCTPGSRKGIETLVEPSPRCPWRQACTQAGRSRCSCVPQARAIRSGWLIAEAMSRWVRRPAWGPSAEVSARRSGGDREDPGEPGASAPGFSFHALKKPGADAPRLARSPRPRRPQGVDPVERFFEDVLIKEEQSAEGLILRAGRAVSIAGEVREEAFDFGVAHLVRVSPGIADLVEDEVAFDPADVALLGVPGVAEESELGANLIHEFHGGSPTGRRVRPRRAGGKVLCRAA